MTKQTLQYICGHCKTVLKESANLEIDPSKVTEPCPSCGYSLAATLTISRPVMPADPVVFQVPTPSKVLTFDLKQLDGFYSGIRPGQPLCILGQSAITLVTRLCVRAILPTRQGGLGSRVVFIDAGNDSDLYQCVNFARQYGMDLSKVLNGIIVSRTFNIYQVARRVIFDLPEAIKQFGAGLVVVSGLLKLFLQDPMIDKAEARRLLDEITDAVKEISADVIIVLSAEETGRYENLFSKFKNKVELSDDKVIASSEYRTKEFALTEKALRLVKVK